MYKLIGGGGGGSKNRSLGQTQSFCVSELILNETITFAL